MTSFERVEGAEWRAWHEEAVRHQVSERVAEIAKAARCAGWPVTREDEVA